MKYFEYFYRIQFEADEPCIEMPQDDSAEYRDHNIVLEIRYRQGEEVPFESRRNVLATSNRRRHGAHQLNLD